jgi:hypothetical protein
MVTTEGLTQASQPLFLPLFSAATVRDDVIIHKISADLTLRIPGVLPTPAFRTFDRVVVATIEIDRNGEEKEDHEKENPEDFFCLQ